MAEVRRGLKEVRDGVSQISSSLKTDVGLISRSLEELQRRVNEGVASAEDVQKRLEAVAELLGELRNLLEKSFEGLRRRLEALGEGVRELQDALDKWGESLEKFVDVRSKSLVDVVERHSSVLLGRVDSVADSVEKSREELARDVADVSMELARRFEAMGARCMRCM